MAFIRDKKQEECFMKREFAVNELIKQALIQLMTKKSHDDITIVELTNKAGVGRASFYRYYKSVDDVFEDIFSNIEIEIEKEIKEAVARGDSNMGKALLEKYFLGLKENSKFILNIIPENRLYFLSFLEKKYENQYRNKQGDMKKRYKAIVNTCIVSGIATEWIISNFKDDPQDLAEFTFNAFLR